jgi:signal transduction histidine kinase/ActR/RegA family two-component response regulator
MLIRFGVVGIVVALAVVALLAAALVRVLTATATDIHDDLEAAVVEQLGQSSRQQADVVSQELRAVHSGTEYLVGAAVDVFERPIAPSLVEVSRYGEGPNGSYVTLWDNGGGAMYYSGHVPIGQAQRTKAGHVAALDPSLQAVVESSALVAQAYINTWDSLNRIYPYFDGSAQYPPQMNIPEYNFYYEADETNNPSRDVVWTDVYVDPAGMGWMVSAIAPVYLDQATVGSPAPPAGSDRLEGVVGLDVTVESLISGLITTQQAFDGFSLLVDENGIIMAMPPRAETVLGLQELTDVDYATFVAQDTFKPEDFDIDTRDDTAELAALLASGPSGSGDILIGGVPAYVAYNTLDETGWRTVAVAEHAAVDELTAAADRIGETVTAVVVLLTIAAIALVLLLTWRARVLSIGFTRPLIAIDDATMRIASGEFRPVLPPAPIAELERTRQHLLEMGERLETAQARMVADAERLRENEERYRSIFENVGEAVAILDADGVVTDANDAATALVGSDPIGLSVTNEMLGSEIWREPGRHVLTVDEPDGPIRVFQITVARWGEAAATRYALTVREITAEQERQRLLEEARETAERTARLKDEFLASMSHEIRTPMNGVIGMLSLMADTDLPVDARANLEVARRSAADLLVLVNDVLDMAKLEADSVSVEPSDVVLREVIDGVVDLLRPLATDQSDAVVVEIDESVPHWMHVDPTRLRQILVNLIGNALKFTENGTIVVRSRFEADPDPTNVGRGLLRFEVVDDGEGIPDEVQQRLFTRFSQGNALGVRRFRGTGLGLAIVKRLAELMGGEVGFTSELGAGSCFWFTVQAAVGSAPAAAPATETTVWSRPLRVLVAEDNEVNQLLFVKMLERLGHTAVTVGDGRQAVETVRQGDFDVVLMDVQMPEMNGVEATHAIRMLPGGVAEIPILAITANVMAEQRSAYVEAGMTGCLPKPLTLAELSAGLVEHVPDPG